MSLNALAGQVVPSAALTQGLPAGGPFIRHAPDGRRALYIDTRTCSYCQHNYKSSRDHCPNCGAPADQ